MEGRMGKERRGERGGRGKGKQGRDGRGKGRVERGGGRARRGGEGEEKWRERNFAPRSFQKVGAYAILEENVKHSQVVPSFTKKLTYTPHII